MFSFLDKQGIRKHSGLNDNEKFSRLICSCFIRECSFVPFVFPKLRIWTIDTISSDTKPIVTC
jgi:hypothetical protein